MDKHLFLSCEYLKKKIKGILYLFFWHLWFKVYCSKIQVTTNKISTTYRKYCVPVSNSTQDISGKMN